MSKGPSQVNLKHTKPFLKLNHLEGEIIHSWRLSPCRTTWGHPIRYCPSCSHLTLWHSGPANLPVARPLVNFHRRSSIVSYRIVSMSLMLFVASGSRLPRFAADAPTWALLSLSCDGWRCLIGTEPGKFLSALKAQKHCGFILGTWDCFAGRPFFQIVCWHTAGLEFISNVTAFPFYPLPAICMIGCCTRAFSAQRFGFQRTIACSPELGCMDR